MGSPGPGGRAPTPQASSAAALEARSASGLSAGPDRGRARSHHCRDAGASLERGRSVSIQPDLDPARLVFIDETRPRNAQTTSEPQATSRIKPKPLSDHGVHQAVHASGASAARRDGRPSGPHSRPFAPSSTPCGVGRRRSASGSTRRPAGFSTRRAPAWTCVSRRSSTR